MTLISPERYVYIVFEDFLRCAEYEQSPKESNLSTDQNLSQEHILTAEYEEAKENLAEIAGKELADMITVETNVGDVIDLDYEKCTVLVHDSLRQEVGGLPLGCFLLASRFTPGATIQAEDEDSYLILLRVLGPQKLINDSEITGRRLQAGQRATHSDDNWDADGNTDPYTRNQLAWAGLSCRVLGSFRMQKDNKERYGFQFRADISNVYAGRGLKVFKPMGVSLKKIVNFIRKIDDEHVLQNKAVEVGRVRYCASEREVSEQGEGVSVSLTPTDLLARRTALFGMSRTGKSNTTKTILSSVFRLREIHAQKGRVGQLVFDVNGEYANENTQDKDGENPSCLKLVGRYTANSGDHDVVTYGLSSHPNDPDRIIAKTNFYGSNISSMKEWFDKEKIDIALDQLRVGRMLIEDLLADEKGVRYMTNFAHLKFDTPSDLDGSSVTRFRRKVTIYRAILDSAGFDAPDDVNCYIGGLFNADLVSEMGQYENEEDRSLQRRYRKYATLLGKKNLTWTEAAEAFKGLHEFMNDPDSGYNRFEDNYFEENQKNWADEDLKTLLHFMSYRNGPQKLGQLVDRHHPGTTSDYASSIVEAVRQGKLVIFDQSVGSPDLVKNAASRIMTTLFNRQQADFINPKEDEETGKILPPPDVVVYAEEAHNLLPAKGTDPSDIWSRTAKEGSKYRIGLAFATQEPSSIQSNILKNTDNWFVAHLNNSDEIKEIKKYYDFEDFSAQILKVPEPGFIRMRTLSNPYVIPIQVKLFKISDNIGGQ